ncbi:glycosyltransferase [Flavihumibacter profundi]|uniref:glycosyltransferase n=1 Tax=Flavihumibacter profundi TaxID=2716883 RepID=UPI001CC33C6F|nr:glycosyltransferase [Flavihumibacter profundi]MBZ5855481.1 glycosyltransferase [Flavihumibacter profundi]
MIQPTHVLFVTIDGGGNIPAVMGLARRLAKQGFNIHVLSEPCMEEMVSAYGFGFTPFKKYFTRSNRKEDFFNDWNSSALSNPTLDKIVFGPAEVVVEGTLEALNKNNIGLLVVDCLLLPALMAAEVLKIPRVVVFHFPEYLPGPNRPPGVMGLLPGKGLFGKLRDKLLSKVFNKVLNKNLSKLNQIRNAYALPPLHSVTDLIHQADLRLIQTLGRFDFPIEPAPANVRYTGPVLDDPDWTTAWTNPWPENDKRPLVVVSLSSTFQNQAKTIQEIIDALRGLEVRGLVTLGMAMEDAIFDAPDNVVIVKSAPHSQVFPLADLVITHAGHGTIMRALANGLPLICLPMGRDQFDNAVKVAYHQCGINLGRKSGASTIRKAIVRLLQDPVFKQNAVRFQKDILAAEQKDIAVSEIKKLCLT